MGSAAGAFGLYAVSSGRMIPAHVTLADFGVWDGAALVVQRAMTACFESSQGVRYLCPDKEFWIGRRATNAASDGNEFPLLDLSNEPNSATISRRHVKVVWHADVWRIRPTAVARNPVTVNGRVLAQDDEVSLQDGDEMKLGAVRLWFRLEIDEHGFGELVS